MTTDPIRFSQQIAQMCKGSLDDCLTDELAEMVKEMRDSHQNAELILKLKLTKSSEVNEDLIDILPSYTCKHPAINFGKTTYLSTADGDLFGQPMQQEQHD